VIVNAAPPVDSRNADDVLQEFWQRSWGYVPEWQPEPGTAGQAIGQVFAQYVYTILQRLNQAPDKNKLAFLDLLGVRLVPASQARAPIVFQLSPQASDSTAPAGTKVAAPPPPGSSQQTVFETETATGIAAANLVELISLWPGRDEYIDHSADYVAKKPVTVFQSTALQPTPHVLYLGHSRLLSFAGNSRLEIEFELEQGSSSPLEILWQYWDGSVWRRFKSLQTYCLTPATQGFDGTNGLMFTGSVRLTTDSAQTALTTVNNASSYWIRGQLNQPLPPDPEELLPVVDSIRLRTTIEQDLEVSLEANFTEGPTGKEQVLLTSEGGGPFVGVAITGKCDQDLSFGIVPGAGGAPGVTGSDGSVQTTPPYIPNCTYHFTLNLFGVQLDSTIKCPSNLSNPQCVLIIKITGLKLDNALVDGQKADVSKPFFPFGQQPQPGATFYFAQQEVLSKSGSSVRAYLSRTVTPQDLFEITDKTGAENPLDHVISWEYWNGFDWVPLAITSEGGASNAGDMDSADVIDFDVPDDMLPTEVNNQIALWIRVRLVSGGFGFTKKITFNDNNTNTNTFTYVITRPPALSDFRLAYVWQTAFSPLDQVLASNDFQYEEHTDDARWPGNSFSPYKPISEIQPALYFGVTQPLPVNSMGIYMDIVEQRDAAAAPVLVWQYFNGAGWRELTVIEDETRNLSLPGIVSFIAPDDSVALARFDKLLHWIRARLKEDGPPQASTLNGIYLNAAWAAQRQTYNDVPLGLSTGLPNQVFNVTQVPVLAGERVEVRELSGAQANVEWRILALELGNGQPTLLNPLQAMLGAEGSQTELIYNDLRLVRDRNKRVTEVWVHWYGRPNLFFSGPGDRHYVVDGALGRFLFGDGVLGKTPPASAAISAREFRSGGGLLGNVDKGTIKQLLGSIGGVQAVFNPRAAEGGANGETLQSFSSRAPDTIRHRGRALTGPDYETMAYEASAGVARARAIPGRDSSGQARPGWITLIIIPQSGDPTPEPSFGLREEVQTYLQTRAPAGVAESLQINVIGPTYLAIDVDAAIAAKDPTQAGTVEDDARAALESFLNPLTGGPGGAGWDLGRGVFLSDIASALAGVRGIDYVQELSLSVNSVLVGNQVEVPPDQIVAPGQIRLKLI
jgi:uncharacterized phage protein gp47/JayE